MEPIFFKNPSKLRKWLEQNHLSEQELILGLYKKGTGKENLSWSQAVDEAICFGWIDGISKRIDDERWQIRLTPRKPNSIWSNVNINKVKILTDSGLMHPKGVEAFRIRKEEKSGIYAFETEEKKLDSEYETLFRANKKAWLFFNSQPPSYKKTALHLVMTAKQEITRQKRLNQLISDSEGGLRMKQLRR